MRLILVCAGMLALSAGIAAAAQDAAQVERGKQVYTAQKCAMCHSVGGVGNAKGSLDGVGSKLSAEEIKLWHTDPKAMMAKTKAERKPAMPSYAAKLSKEDLDAITAYMLSLKKK
jgi:mono/diheme cytochrome c family protein